MAKEACELADGCVVSATSAKRGRVDALVGRQHTITGGSNKLSFIYIITTIKQDKYVYIDIILQPILLIKAIHFDLTLSKKCCVSLEI